MVPGQLHIENKTILQPSEIKPVSGIRGKKGLPHHAKCDPDLIFIKFVCACVCVCVCVCVHTHHAVYACLCVYVHACVCMCVCVCVVLYRKTLDLFQ